MAARDFLPPLEKRFSFVGDAVSPGDREALRSALFDVEDSVTGFERGLKLWRKTGTAVDGDLRQLWLHEMRQIQRVMSYSGAREVIVDVLEFVEDAENFGVLLERVGQPLSMKLPRVNRGHWLKTLDAIRPRSLLWRNVRRLAVALGIIHSQGLVHGRIGADVVMTEAAESPDFKLGGFEWSISLSAPSGPSPSTLSPAAIAERARLYSFAEDWKELGRLVARLLDCDVDGSGGIRPTGCSETTPQLSISERSLLRRLIAPTRMDHLDADSIVQAIDDIVASIGRSVASRAGTFILTFTQSAGLGDAVYAATEGAISTDEYLQQLEWVRADLDGGCTLLIPRSFDPSDQMMLVTDSMVYRLKAFVDEGVPVWDIALCSRVETRSGGMRSLDQNEHQIQQPIEVVARYREAIELRARLGPDALVWSGFAEQRREGAAQDSIDRVRQALVLVELTSAVVKALEVYPVEVIRRSQVDGRKYVILSAEPDSDRDRMAKGIGLSDSFTALSRLFEEDGRQSESGWRVSLYSGLGETRKGDVEVSFVEVDERGGRRGYRFEVYDDVPEGRRLFLKGERDTGTEKAIGRRLRAIKALSTRADLAEMLADPWRLRRSSRESIDAEGQGDSHFLDLDKPKREALQALWSILPTFFVVGPPGVGKTKLATETVRRRFASDKSTRMLISAQGHDALDHLQQKVKEALDENGLGDVIVVRSNTPDRRAGTEEELNKATVEYLKLLAESEIAHEAPPSLRERVQRFRDAGLRMPQAKDTVSREERAGLNAVSNLVLDSANIVISTANSADIERLVEAREQFDWVVIEEAAKATGPELVGALMLSGRRLLIGDHHQLPPFDSERLIKILSDHSLVKKTLELAEQFVGSLMRDGELEELIEISKESEELKATADFALRLLEPFRTFVVDDERRTLSNPRHSALSATLTEQRRMDPAIAEIVSTAFYKGKLDTEANRRNGAEEGPYPIAQVAPLPRSPVVVVDFKHVSETGQGQHVEVGRPRWHNPSEVNSVMDVLRLVHPGITKSGKPTLAILSPYKAQVDKLHTRVQAGIRSGEFKHLKEFAPARPGGEFVGTVDSFQGSEADLVIISLVRNNGRAGARALGFLRDRRRMNVALSRAKHQLVVVGSMKFLREAVRGVNPDDIEVHDLSFLVTVVDTVTSLAKRTRGDGVPLASIVTPESLWSRK